MTEHDGRPTVAVLGCEDYDERRVHEAIGRGLSLLGGVERFVRAGEKILLKPNMLAGTGTEKAVTTHPEILKSVARHFQAAGAVVSYGDSPGFGRPETVARQAGFEDAAREQGIAWADFTNGRIVSFPEGYLVKQFTIAEGALAADGLVSLSKLKTHAVTRLTGAVKNQFGCVPGLLKGEFHARLPELDLFAQMLVDLTRLLKPRLYVMDAILAMEGNGPRNGHPRRLGVMLMSADPVALDATACRLMRLDPDMVPTIPWGERQGLGTRHAVLAGDDLDAFIAPDFAASRERLAGSLGLPKPVFLLMRRYIASRPEIMPAECTRCGTCVQVCPLTPKALSFRDRKTPPVYDYGACIRCYCCQEMCPDAAITVRKTPLGRLLKL